MEKKLSGNRRAMLLVAALALAFRGSAAEAEKSPPGPAELRVMTYNIKTLILGLGPSNWWLRRNDLAELIRNQQPDLIGMQEVYTLQARDLEERLPGYAWFGLPRGDGQSKGERCPIFYRTERLELLEQATFWLSETPEAPGSRDWGSAFPRIVTWGKFRDKASGGIFFHFNTHFDHLSAEARKNSAALFVERIRAVAGDAPAVVTGDFNFTPEAPPYATMTAGLADSRLISLSPPEGPERTLPALGRRIDYIFVSQDFKVERYGVIMAEGRQPSDHLAVLAEIKISK